MEIKTIEIRDAGTFIPAFAVRGGARNEAERYLWGRAGFGKTPGDQERHVVLVHLQTMRAGYDEYEISPGTRTLAAALVHLREHWDEIENGQVIDLEFIHGLRETPKVSERMVR